MQNKVLAILAAALLAAGCMNGGVPYEAGDLNLVRISMVYPDGLEMGQEAVIGIEEVSGITSSRIYPEGSSTITTYLPNGIFRISARDRQDDIILNATIDNYVISGKDANVEMVLKKSKAGAIVIKEIYCGGCSMAPVKDDNYQFDKYVILHNNSIDTYYLDGLCMGTLEPYNSNASNKWLSNGQLPDFLPVIQAVLMMPGSGQDYPLAPGEDAILAICGAIDHSQEYPLSVNLNRPDVFALYDPVLFSNTKYHPAPGPLVSADRYIKIVIKMGQANAYTLSVNSPTFILFRTPEGTDIYDYVADNANIHQAPGSSDKVVAVPFSWVLDGAEVFNGSSTGNQKRLPEVIDAGAVSLSETAKGHTLMRYVDEQASMDLGFEVLVDTNNSTEDFYERDTQSLHE